MTSRHPLEPGGVVDERGGVGRSQLAVEGADDAAQHRHVAIVAVEDRVDLRPLQLHSVEAEEEDRQQIVGAVLCGMASVRSALSLPSLARPAYRSRVHAISSPPATSRYICICL